MASSSSATGKANINDEMQQLLQLQRGGIISTTEFLRMSAEISKTDADHLREARLADDGDDSDADLIEEDGRPFDGSRRMHSPLGSSSGGNSGGSGGGSVAGNSFDDEPDGMADDEEEEASPASPAPAQMLSGPESWPSNTK
eukprot:125930-Prymnesium_polylepis.1